MEEQSYHNSKFVHHISFSKELSLKFVQEACFLFIKSNDVSYDFGETEKDIGTIINVKVSFIRLGCIPILTCWGYDDRWSFKTLEITRGTEPVVKLCPTTQFIVTDSAAVTFNVC